MRYLVFHEPERTVYPVSYLVPILDKSRIQTAYLDPYGINSDEVMCLDLHYTPGKKKTPVAEMKKYIEEMLIPLWNQAQTEYVFVADSEYFKVLTKAAKVEANLGYIMDCAYGPQKIIYIPNYRAIFFDPDSVRSKISRATQAFIDHRAGTYEDPGNEIIRKAEYISSPVDITKWLTLLMEKPALTCDIEGFSLRHTKAGIGTITFCWNEHEGIAFPVDLGTKGIEVRVILKQFFEAYQGRMIYHSIGYDVTVIIYQLFMSDILDTESLLNGLEVMLRNWDCTKLIAYLATNSCAGNKLSLKDLAQEYAGNYGLGGELHDITKIPLEKLLTYNLVDGLSTWYVYNKYRQTVIDDQQEDIYQNIFKPAQRDIIQMQLTGMPVNMERVLEVKDILETELQQAITNILNNNIIKQFTKEVLNVQHAIKRNAKLKTKQIKPEDEPQVFNPNSDLNKRELFFNFLDLPVINLTDSKQPSTDGESVEALINHVTDSEILDLLENFRQHAAINILTTNFIPALLGSIKGPDGWHYLYGSFNLGGTLSGRLSSSDPNLQNLPSTGKGNPIKLRFAKLIKSCFQAPPGWLFCGIDFSSLEDRISAVTTKDPNKLKVYTDGYDGHSLRAFAYFPQSMPDIIDTVESINSIQKKYKPLRDRSKNPTFTLTYQGTYIALVKKYGFSLEQAKEVEARYHALYKVSDDWVNARLDKAMTDGYITAAFGLRLRTPLLKQVIRGTSKTPYEAEAEGRTAGNALGQSWCLLNSRAGSEFLSKVRASQFRLMIRPCAQIHDASYFIIKDDLAALEYTNEHLVKAIQWQNHPDIWHDEVKLGGEFSIFYPDWNKEITIPNGAKGDEIYQIVTDSLAPKPISN